MTRPVPIHRALISVSDKSDVAAFARGLADLGVELVSTGGTAAALRAAGLTVIEVSEVTGFPEMMDGRVKTLHPAVHGALLARRDAPAHVDSMTAHGFVPIDLVCINLYPFEQTVADASVGLDEAIEQIDIGGPAVLRSAAKNHEFVTVVTSPSQYDRVISELREHDGCTSMALRSDLARIAFLRTAEYDRAISAWLCESIKAPRRALADSVLDLAYTWTQELRYGENPHQAASLYLNAASTEPSVVSARMHHGKPLSYNNILDAAAAHAVVQDLTTLCRQRDAAAAVIKHTNPCGAAIAADLGAAFERAYEGDPQAAYGGILAVSRPIDDAVAERIAAGRRFLEVIVAPDFEPPAIARLGERWKNVRLLAVPGEPSIDSPPLDYRSVPGGMLVQQRDIKPADARQWVHAAGPAPSSSTLDDAAMLWMVAKHLKSNAIAVGRDGQLLGAGAGQVDRVTACRLACWKAAEHEGDGGALVAASDAFFPFADGPALLIDAGVGCIVQPGGSKRDDETLALCDERGVTCLLTGVRHFRH